MKLSIDELNIPVFDAEAYIEEYFSPMGITEEQKDERKQASRDFRDFLLTLFLFLGIQSEYIAVNWKYVEDMFRTEFEQAALRYANNTPMLTNYIADKASDFVRITRENIDKGEYWTSDERATYEAVNEANEVLGMTEFQKALESGKKYKTWHGIMDRRERKSHIKMENKRIPINDYFLMDKGILLYPGDAYNGEPEEVDNCRCWLTYE